MMKKFVPGFRLQACLALLLCFSSLASISAQSAAEIFEQHGRWENGVSEGWWFPDSVPKAEIVKLIRHWESIGKVNEAARGNAWDGDYFTGDETHGSYLRWSQSAGFVIVKVNKCAAQVEGFSYGKISDLSPLIQFIPEQVVVAAHAHGHGQLPQRTTNFVPVNFRGERLLIAEAEMARFGDYVAGLGAFNESHFISYAISSPFFFNMREEDASLETGSRTVVPPGYEKFLKTPIEATIKAIHRRWGKSKFTYEAPSGGVTSYPDPVTITFITITAGTAQGVTRGMIFRIIDTGEDVRIIRTGTSTSVGLIVRSLDEKGRETFYDDKTGRESIYPKVRVGWRLTTSPF